MDYTYEDIAKMIDHSLLNPTLTAAEMERGCRLALDYDVASVCILPYYLGRCAEMLAGSRVKASTTIGFPHGCHTTAVKVAEAERALADGGQELDMVVNISAALSGDWQYVRDDLAAVIAATHAAGQAACVRRRDHRRQVVADVLPVAAQRRADVHHHVQFLPAVGQRPLRLGHFDGRGVAAVREADGSAGFHPAPRQHFRATAQVIRKNADAARIVVQRQAATTLHFRRRQGRVQQRMIDHLGDIFVGVVHDCSFLRRPAPLLQAFAQLPRFLQVRIAAGRVAQPPGARRRGFGTH